MTTITIERALLKQALEALELVTEDYDDSAVGLEIEAIQAIRSTLAAPATAPEQPSWHDAPTVSGAWVCNYGELSIATVNQPDIDAFDPAYNAGGRWFGPLPEDKP